MARKRHTAEQIINHLRQVEVMVARGKSVREAIRQIGVTEQTYYRWRKDYGGMDTTQCPRLEELERENARLKRIVADQALDISILREVGRGNL
jgi:putative transposase